MSFGTKECNAPEPALIAQETAPLQKYCLEKYVREVRPSWLMISRRTENVRLKQAFSTAGSLVDKMSLIIVLASSLWEGNREVSPVPPEAASGVPGFLLMAARI